jgi:hypothetical protein
MQPGHNIPKWIQKIMPIKTYGINPENSDFPVRIFLTTKKPPRERVAFDNQYFSYSFSYSL